MSRKISILLALVALASCAEQAPGTPLDPQHYIYWPVSVEVVQTAPGTPGVLYVVSSNIDRRYTRAAVVAIDLGKLPASLPPVVDAPIAGDGVALIDSFGGQFALYQPTGASASQRTLFIPTRARNQLYALRADGAKLTCWDQSSPDCLSQGIPLANANSAVIDAFGAAVRGSKLYVNHLRSTAVGTITGTSYLVEIDAEAPTDPQSFVFHDIGLAPSEGLAISPAGVYLAGKALASHDAVLRLFDPANPNATLGDLLSDTRLKEARGLAISSDGNRLFMAVRGTASNNDLPASGPDGLAIIDISVDPVSGAPRHQLLSFTPTPLGPTTVKVVPRAGRRDLVAISCTTANQLALYDDEIGEVAGLVQGFSGPSGIAYVTLSSGTTRLFVADFGNNSVDLVDIPDLTRPRGATVVSKLATTPELVNGGGQ